MKRILVLIAVAITISIQVNSQMVQGGSVEQTIMKMEQEMLTAMLKGDASANERYMAANSVFTDPGGNVMNKSQLVSMIKSGDLKFESSVIDSMKVQVYGNTAIANYRTTDKGKFKDMDISGLYRWTDVFVKQNNNWQLVAGHGSKIMQQ